MTNRTPYDFHTLLCPVPAAARFEDPEYFIWCGTAVRGDDGRCHMYYSRWPRRLGFHAWVSHSEVAYAVADSPFGPWRHAGLALPARSGQYWDGDCTHNPTVLRAEEDGRYYLYYMGNRGDGVATPGQLNWTHRNNQRIGVAVADQPEGPWRRFDAPIIDSTPGFYDALCCANPSVTARHARHGGGYLMVYKAVNDRGAMPFGGPVLHCVALSESPAGPFIKQPQPVFISEGTHFAAEDPFIWRLDEAGAKTDADTDAIGYRAIVKDMGGYFTGRGRSLALFESTDGLNWNLARCPFVSGTEILWQSESESAEPRRQMLHALERPQLLFADSHAERGCHRTPQALFCAAEALDGTTFNVQIPLATGRL
ncbi:MAG: glycoside hydrolase family protein [Candidatus Methylacidiphilales bacterium]|nr:glycoside hydrolase family protein [Candidatus Methylacidiphilales bacterium]